MSALFLVLLCLLVCEGEIVCGDNSAGEQVHNFILALSGTLRLNTLITYGCQAVASYLVVLKALHGLLSCFT